MSDYGDNDYSDPGNFDDDNMGDDMDDGDQESDEASSRSGDEVDSSEDSNPSETESESQSEVDKDEYPEEMVIIKDQDRDQQASKTKVTPPFLTKYEKARIIGTRALQIAQNSPIYVETDDKDYDPIAIAEKEFVQKKIPFIIRRYLPNKEYEDWALDELEVLD
ncbi:hypothetical protein ABPG74_014017 [Tetrahymena malaccensis]